MITCFELLKSLQQRVGTNTEILIEKSHIMLQAIKWLLVWIFLVLKPSMHESPFNNSGVCVCNNLWLSERVLTSRGDADSCEDRCKNLADQIKDPLTLNNQGTLWNSLIE